MNSQGAEDAHQSSSNDRELSRVFIGRIMVTEVINMVVLKDEQHRHV